MKRRTVDYYLKCQFNLCGRIFGTHNARRKYCSVDCAENAQGGADRHMGRMEKDPTPEEIARMCQLIRDGDLVVESTQPSCGGRRARLKPNWVVQKKIK